MTYSLEYVARLCAGHRWNSKSRLAGFNSL